MRNPNLVPNKWFKVLENPSPTPSISACMAQLFTGQRFSPAPRMLSYRLTMQKYTHNSNQSERTRLLCEKSAFRVNGMEWTQFPTTEPGCEGRTSGSTSWSNRREKASACPLLIDPSTIQSLISVKYRSALASMERLIRHEQNTRWNG